MGSFNSEDEEQYFNIDDDQLDESQDMVYKRGQLVRTYKPGHSDAINGFLPQAPGFNKVAMWKKNKASKGRVKVNPNKRIESCLYNDVNGDDSD